jgi:hypothetical protein
LEGKNINLSEFWSIGFGRENSKLQGIQENANMPCHAMHPKQVYFRRDFYMQGLV